MSFQRDRMQGGNTPLATSNGDGGWKIGLQHMGNAVVDRRQNLMQQYEVHRSRDWAQWPLTVNLFMGLP
jgi:hypothetical protein